MLIIPKKQKKKSEKELPHSMILNDNAIYYVHWDNPNELVDRLRLLYASHRVGNNVHNNEMLSIIFWRGTSRSRSYYKLNRVSMK